MPYEANLIPVDVSLFANVLLPFVMGDASADKAFNQYLSDAVRIHRVQRQTQMLKKCFCTPNPSITTISGRGGDSKRRNSSSATGAALGDQSPSASLLTDHRERTVSDGQLVPNQSMLPTQCLSPTSSSTLRSLMGRPFFIPSDSLINKSEIGDAYTRYRLAQPQDVDDIVHDLCSRTACSIDEPSRASSALPGVIEPSDEVIRHELSWKMGLLRDAHRNLGRLRAVFDRDGELYHPHQLLGEEAAMILVECASRFNPGWTTDGPWNPQQLLQHYSTRETRETEITKQAPLFQSASELFAPLARAAPSLKTNLNHPLTHTYQVGGYLPSHRMAAFIETLESTLTRVSKMSHVPTEHSHALNTWLEAAIYAHGQKLGLIETADLYNRKEGILN